jgi:hypothetical protein
VYIRERVQEFKREFKIVQERETDMNSMLDNDTNTLIENIWGREGDGRYLPPQQEPFAVKHNKTEQI